MVNGTSNSWAAFKASQEAGSKWEDPEFKADVYSLRWDEFGNSGGYAPPTSLAWARPPDMGAYNDRFTSDPSLWGNTGNPRPNGVA